MKCFFLAFLVGPALSFSPIGVPRRFHTPARDQLRLQTRIRAPGARASAKIIPVAYASFGGALLAKAADATGAARLTLASAGLLSLLNLATIDNQRYAGAKRAMARLDGDPSAMQDLARKWYNIVRIHLISQLASLAYMVRANGATGVLRGGACFMAANLLFFLLGAAEAKHDGEGKPSPIKPKLKKFVLMTDIVLFAAASLGSLYAADSIGRLVGSCLFSAGCMIGAIEGAPKSASAMKQILRRRS